MDVADAHSWAAVTVSVRVCVSPWGAVEEPVLITHDYTPALLWKCTPVICSARYSRGGGPGSASTAHRPRCRSDCNLRWLDCPAVALTETRPRARRTKWPDFVPFVHHGSPIWSLGCITIWWSLVKWTRVCGDELEGTRPFDPQSINVQIWGFASLSACVWRNAVMKIRGSSRDDMFKNLAGDSLHSFLLVFRSSHPLQ